MPTNLTSARELQRRHDELCFNRAFPVSLNEHRTAGEQLLEMDSLVASLSRAVRHDLWDSGIVGTPLHYRFSFDVACWLARRAKGEVSIDWSEIRDTTRIDDLLLHVLQPSEDEYFDSGYTSSRDWIELARAGCPGTDFDWLMAQLQEKRLRRYWTQLYDSADLPLIWNLGGSKSCKSRNVLPVKTIKTRERGMRGRPRSVKKEIQRPLASIQVLSRRDGAKLIDVAKASLATRHRETNHFNHANPDEVYLADVDQGVSIAVFGLLAERRFPLESTMGFLILSNGVPVGYGGSSILFRQVNTGINIFDEFRGSEASYLWVQVMRVFHALVGSTRFIANPYQFGSENTEALRSGAFWFYYRLGFRPVVAEIRDMARSEAAKKRHNKAYRSDVQTLRKLASCDMRLTLPGARHSDLFNEEWLTTSSMLATEILSAAGEATRTRSASRVTLDVARVLGIRSLDSWSKSERRCLDAIAPIVSVANPKSWPTPAKHDMRKLLRAKGGKHEAQFARMMCNHDEFLAGLQKACRDAEKLA